MGPISGGLLTELFKKLLNLFGDELAKKFKNKKTKARDNLVSLFSHMKELEKNIDFIIRSLDVLLADSNNSNQANDMLSEALLETDKIMSTIAQDLKILAPGFEIIAEDVAPKIEGYLETEALFIGFTGLLREYNFEHSGEREPIQIYKDRLTEIKALGIEAKKSLVDFIRKSYTWEKFHE